MKHRHGLLAALLLLPVLAAGTSDEKPLLELEGEYLVYSYDFNQLYGERVRFDLGDLSVTAGVIRIDFTSRTFHAGGGLLLQSGDGTRAADELFFRPQEGTGLLITYGESIRFESIGDGQIESFLALRKNTASISLTKMTGSLFYFTGRKMEIASDYDVFGRNVTLYIEGLESFGLKKFKLSEGIKQVRSGFALDRLWYSKSQGLQARASYIYQKENKISSISSLDYEEHSILKGYEGLPRQVDLRTDNTFVLTPGVALNVQGNYNSSSLWDSRLALTKNWNDLFQLTADFSYNKPVNRKGEVWVGLAGRMNSSSWGNLQLAGRYEKTRQYLAELAYERELFKNTRLRLDSSYAKIRIGGSGDYSEIFSGTIDLAYTSEVFDMGANYFLNNDLFGKQLLSQPQLRVGLRPFSLYSGLLTASLSNMFIWNRVQLEDTRLSGYSDNLVFKVGTSPLPLQNTLSLKFDLAVEQFLEKEGRNFTSGGLLMKLQKELFRGIRLEGFYSYQTRRKTEGWLIEGTSGQDLSAVLRVNPTDKLNGWISVSYDPKTDRFRQSFADIMIGLIKNWKFHSQINYDFLLNRLNNIDLYLIREAGRFQVRVVWRSLSRQILIELVPN